MKIKNTIYTLGILMLSFGACKDALDPKVEGSYSDADTWRLPAKAQGVLMNAYANTPGRFDFYAGNNFLDAVTDNAVSNDVGSAIFQMGEGRISPMSNPVGDWSNAYTQFRNIHLFLENGLGPNVVYDLTGDSNDQEYKQRLKGEAYFLRAWWGFQLLQAYGGKTNTGEALGYPIVLKTLTDQEAMNLDVKRNTYEECAVQIMEDCDQALANLPLRYQGDGLILGLSNIGRADRQIAAALKARVALYAASPAYQPDAVTRLNGQGSFTVVDAATYQSRWERATTMAQAAITLIGNFTSLKETDFNKSGAMPADFLYRRWFNNNNMEKQQYPPYEFGVATTGPSQNLVDAFPALNGYPITDARSNYDPQNPYASRDPRLNLNVYYNNRIIDGRPLEVFDGGLDSRTRFPNASRSGYYVRKWLSTKVDMLNPEAPQNDFHYYVMLRKTEYYLSYAEAANEAYGPNAVPPGSTQSASTVIKNIRRGAGLTGASSDAYVNEVAALGKDAFRSLIQNERRLELAFENHRFFDMRRWVLPLNENVKGVKVVRTAANTFEYSTVDIEPRRFNELKYYYLPIPYSEITKSPGLVNNLGW